MSICPKQICNNFQESITQTSSDLHSVWCCASLTPQVHFISKLAPGWVVIWEWTLALYWKFDQNGRYVRTPILATLVSINLPFLATDKICQFWQLITLVNFGNWWYLPTLASGDICQLWQLVIFANFGNWRLPILTTGDICQLWQLLIFANFGNWCLPILATGDIFQFWRVVIFANFGNWWYFSILANCNFGYWWHLPSFGMLQFNKHVLTTFVLMTSKGIWLGDKMQKQ